MKRLLKTMYVVGIVSIVCASASAQAKTLPKTAKLVPAETVLLVDIEDFSQLKQQFEKTNLYKLYKEPAMAAFVGAFRTKWHQKVQELDSNNIFRAFFEAGVLPQGKVAVALVLGEQTKDSNEPTVLVISQWGEEIDKIKEAVSKMLEKNIECGGHQKKSEDYRGVSIEISIDETSSVLNHCFIDDCFIASTNLEVLKFVIAHIKGASSPTLADDIDYVSVIGAVGPYHDVDFYFNIKQIIKTALAENTTGQAQTTMAHLGFDNVASFGGSISLGRSPGSSYLFKAFLKVNGAKRGICKMLETESSVLRTPRFVPASTYSATFLNLDIKKAYNELYNILYGFSPMYAAMLHTPLLPPSPDGQPGLQLKTDVIDYLGSQIVIAQSVNKPFSSSSAPTELLIALGVSNRSALEKSMSLLYSKAIAPNNPDARRELLGHTIYLMSLGRLPFLPTGMTPMQSVAESDTAQIPKLAFTVTDTHLIFGVESTVERAIRTLSSAGTASVSSAKWFTTAKSAIPSVVGLAYLEDNASSSEILWWMLKEAGRTKTSTGSTGPASLKFKPLGVGELINGGLLPEFDTVRKYFGLSAFYGVSRADGFFFEFKYLNSSGTD